MPTTANNNNTTFAGLLNNKQSTPSILDPRGGKLVPLNPVPLNGLYNTCDMLCVNCTLLCIQTLYPDWSYHNNEDSAVVLKNLEQQWMAKKIMYLTGKMMAEQEQDKELRDSCYGGGILLVRGDGAVKICFFHPFPLPPALRKSKAHSRTRKKAV